MNSVKSNLNIILNDKLTISIKKELRRIYKKVRSDKFQYLLNNPRENEIILKSFEDKLIYLIKNHNTINSNINSGEIFICCYYPIQSEIDILKIVSNIKDYKIRIGLPKTFDNLRNLKFYEFIKEENLKEGVFNLREPDPEKSREIIPDFIITPLLAFDKHKHRLGYGKGYYDNTFINLKEKGIKFTSIGIAYDEQFYNQNLPLCEFDQMLDHIITPTIIL